MEGNESELARIHLEELEIWLNSVPLKWEMTVEPLYNDEFQYRFKIRGAGALLKQLEKEIRELDEWRVACTTPEYVQQTIYEIWVGIVIKSTVPADDPIITTYSMNSRRRMR